MAQNLPLLAVLLTACTMPLKPPPGISKQEPEEAIEYEHDRGQLSDAAPQGRSANNAAQDSTAPAASSDNIEPRAANAPEKTAMPESVRDASARRADSPAPSGRALTDHEEIGRMDDSLERKLGEFDELILRERERIATESNQKGGMEGDFQGENVDGDGRFDETGGTRVGETNQTTVGDVDETAAPVADHRLPAVGADVRRDEYEPQQSDAHVPEDIPDGGNDNIVARQLREAAMREKDPALRERLWDEYRKYKQGIDKD